MLVVTGRLERTLPVFGDPRLRDLKSGLEQLVMDARRTPKRVLDALRRIPQRDATARASQAGPL